ncbi:hypothetical protein E2C01_086228 [Portunus trituberculatus]|uniref:Uncharacterized protein n=1 Tax=Portunus trituberculatus TaxID=210409 RepID=A0A5B7JE11_PORTR|nr:hypothetical protein [Portunus trituberculatus]
MESESEGSGGGVREGELGGGAEGGRKGNQQTACDRKAERGRDGRGNTDNTASQEEEKEEEKERGGGGGGDRRCPGNQIEEDDEEEEKEEARSQSVTFIASLINLQRRQREIATL